MKAIVCTKYGPPDVLQQKDVKKPVPKDNEVLVRIYATSVTAADYRIRGLHVPVGFSLLVRMSLGFRKPRKEILGVNFSGKIETAGKDVTQFRAGDAVFGSNGTGFGAYAEYICLPEKGVLATKPNNMSYDEAAAIPFGALTALSFLRDKGNIQQGSNVLINGASGAVGTAAIQLSKYFGAVVSGVCSTTNLELVKSLGANNVIDYTKVDFTQNAETYDIILDTVGNLSLLQCKNSLTIDGRFLAVATNFPQLIQVWLAPLLGSRKAIAGSTAYTSNDLLFLKELIESEKLKTVIDRSYPMEQIIEAHRYAEKGHKKGNVVITLPHSTAV